MRKGNDLPADGRDPTRHRQRERGNTLLTFALTSAVVFGCLALAIDLGYAYSQRRLAQNTADLTAIAGTAMLARSYGLSSGGADIANAIQEVQDLNIPDRSVEYANFSLSAQYVDAAGGAIGSVGSWAGGAPPANATGVHVDASRTFPTWFGRFLSGSGATGGAGGDSWSTSGGATISNEAQRVTITGDPNGGTFRLTFKGATTAPIAWNADAAVVAASLNALSTIGGAGGWVEVSGGLGGDYVVVFRGSLAGANQPRMTAASSLTDHEGHSTVSVGVTIVTLTEGGRATQPVRDVSVAAAGTATLKPVTAVAVDHPDFAPYIVWSGSLPQCKSNLGVTFPYMENGYQAAWVDTDCSGDDFAEPLWQGSANNFRGYLHDATGVIRVGQTLTISTAGGNAYGNQPLEMMQVHYQAGRPVIMPVIRSARVPSGSNITLEVVAFALVQLVNPPCTNSGHGCASLGKIVNGSISGVYTDGNVRPTGTNAPAKTVVLSQ